jgi:hypothetical protein
MENPNEELINAVDEFAEELKQELLKAGERWGDTWKERGIEGQEQRFFDWVKGKSESNEGINPVKVAGEALIMWYRNNKLKRVVKYKKFHFEPLGSFPKNMFLILFTLKLIGIVSASWLWVLSPLWIALTLQPIVYKIEKLTKDNH